MRTMTRFRSLFAGSRLSVGLALTLVAVGCQPGLHSEATDSASATGGAAATAWRDNRTGLGGVVELAYDDVAGAERRIRFELRMPDGDTDGPVPVVVWTHGGGTGKTNPAVVGNAWGEAFNRAGIAFVAVAHPGRTDAGREALCEAVGADPCDLYQSSAWDRPNDAQHVFDWIDEHGVAAGIDPDRIVYGGHSAGGASTMIVAGTDSTFGSELAPPSDDRPIAFVVASPPGVQARGFDEEQLADLDRPMLFLTGLGDTTNSTEGPDRRATFGLLPDEPTSFLLYVADERARHGAFNLSRVACRRSGGTDRQCRTLVRTIASVGTEFVTSVTSGGDPRAYFTLVEADLSGPFQWHHT